MPSLETHMPCTCRARAELGLAAGSWWWKCSKGTICTSAMSSKTEPFRFEGAPWLEKSRVKLALAKPRPDERWGKHFKPGETDGKLMLLWSSLLKRFALSQDQFSPRRFWSNFTFIWICQEIGEPASLILPILSYWRMYLGELQSLNKLDLSG